MANYLREFATESAYTEATLNYPSVSLIDENGTVHFDQTAPTPPTPPTPKWVATYTGGSVSSAECDSTSAITYGEISDTNLVSLEIGDCVTEIGYVCMQALSLTSCTIGSGVTSISDYAISNANNMQSITINATTPPTIQTNTFGWTNNCPIYVPANSVNAYKSAWSGYASRIEAIPTPVFEGKWKATYTGGTVSTADCDSTSAITSSDGFKDDGTLIEIVIGDCVTEIGEQAFSYCENLSAVTMPDSVTSIGNGAFNNCRSLTGITIPEGITSIGYGTFQGCSGLTSIDIPDSVTSIDGYGFSNCSGLTSVTIPSGVTSIGIYAFISCKSLTGITCLATTPPTLDTFPFGVTQFNDTNNCPIYVPYGSVDNYKAANGWSSYASRIQAIP